MTQAKGLRCFIAPLSAAVMMAGIFSAQAQEISESHLAAARSAITAIKATDQFDAILPQAAMALKAELIQKDPNLEELISTAVDETALALASRRADLENEAARAYAVAFTEDDLKAITQFYSSPAGQKLINEGPIVSREVVKAASIWQNGVARDLAKQVGDKIAAGAPATEAPAPQQ